MISARRGFSLLEVIVAAVILAALMSVCLQLLGAMASQRRAIDGRQRAIHQAANIMQRVCGRPWSELTDENVRRMQQGEQSLRAMPAVRVEIRLAQSPDELDAKQITVLIHWEDNPGRPARPIRLVAWRYRGIDD